MALNVDSLPSEPDQFNSYLDELDDEQLGKLEAALVKRFEELSQNTDNLDDAKMARIAKISEQISASRVAKESRRSAAATSHAELTAKQHQEALAALSKVVSGDKDSSAQLEVPSPGMEQLTSALASAMQTAVTQVATVTAGGTPGLNDHIRNMPLGKVQQMAPDPKLAPARSEAVLVASADIPGRAKNGTISGVTDLVDLIGARSRMMGVTRGNANYVPVAYLKRDFRYRMSLDSTPQEINEVLTAATDVGALVAAGGWCAPSEVSYDFFNIVCEDGMIDLPTVGVLNRGGFRFPTSPTIADIFADPDALWSWTEQQDVEAITSDSTVKTCVRVPCPEFDEVRAHCDGLCITAGNLTDFAYPELIENFIQLVMAARAHRTNQQVIEELVAAATPVNMAGSNEGTASSVLNSIELQAIDYRERFRMCEDAVLEAVFPRWVLGAIRADFANRNGVENPFDVTNQQIASWFDRRNVRAQFVADWQSGFDGEPIGDPNTIATGWPATVQYMIYAPGTFVRGQGLQLDLGVVRDSVLNERNDHTAAWMEDCYATAMVGHEARLVTTDVCTAGPTGAADLVCGTS